MGCDGVGRIPDDGHVHTPWRKRLALLGVNVDDGLPAEVIARTRQALLRDALDGWLNKAMERLKAAGVAPALG